MYMLKKRIKILHTEVSLRANQKHIHTNETQTENYENKKVKTGKSETTGTDGKAVFLKGDHSVP